MNDKLLKELIDFCKKHNIEEKHSGFLVGLFVKHSVKEEQPEKIVRELPSDEEIDKWFNETFTPEEMDGNEGVEKFFYSNHIGSILIDFKNDLIKPIITRQSKEIEELKSEVEKAKELIKGALRCRDLWMPNETDLSKIEHCYHGEIQMLVSMENKFKEFLEGTKTK